MVLELAFDPKDATGILQPYVIPPAPQWLGGSGGSVKDEGMGLDSAVAVGIWPGCLYYSGTVSWNLV